MKRTARRLRSWHRKRWRMWTVVLNILESTESRGQVFDPGLNQRLNEFNEFISNNLSPWLRKIFSRWHLLHLALNSLKISGYFPGVSSTWGSTWGSTWNQVENFRIYRLIWRKLHKYTFKTAAVFGKTAAVFSKTAVVFSETPAVLPKTPNILQNRLFFWINIQAVHIYSIQVCFYFGKRFYEIMYGSYLRFWKNREKQEKQGKTRKTGKNYVSFIFFFS